MATVVANNDSQALGGKMGRIKVTVPHLLEADSVDSLPWVMPLIPIGVAGAVNSGVAALSVPRIGSRVAVIVQEEDLQNCLYVGTILKSGELPTDLQTNYPNRVGFVDSVGNTFYFDLSNNTLYYKHPSGTTLTISSNGAVTLTSATDVTLTATNNLRLAGETVKVHAGSVYAFDANGQGQKWDGSGVETWQDNDVVRPHHNHAPPEIP
jgi:hypothetical protein